MRGTRWNPAFPGPELTKPPTPCFLQGSPGKTGPRGGVVSASTSPAPGIGRTRQGGGRECYSPSAALLPLLPRPVGPPGSETLSISRATREWLASQERKARR